MDALIHHGRRNVQVHVSVSRVAESWKLASSCLRPPFLTSIPFPDMQTRYANMWRCDETQKYNYTCGILGEPSTCGDPKDYYFWDDSDLTNITTPQLGLSVLASEVKNTTTSSSSKNALGIGLGVGLGVPLAFSGAALIWLYAKLRNLQERFNKLSQEQQRSVTPSSKFQVMNELDTGGVSGSSELQSNPRSELAS